MNALPRGLLLVWLDVPVEMDDEFNEWYNTEHIPEREAVPGFLSARRFVADQGGPRYLAIYDLQHEDVLRSAPYMQITGANESAWTRRIRRKATHLVRNVYEQILPPPGTGVWVTGPALRTGDPSGSALLVEAADVGPGVEAEFNQWYNEEHVQGVLENPGFQAARRFRALEGQPRYLALYELDSAGVSYAQTHLGARDPGEMAAATGMPRVQPAIQHMLYRQIYP